MPSKTVRSKSQGWISLLAADPRPWLLASTEPAARFIALTSLNGCSENDPLVRAKRSALLADAGIKNLIGRLPDWEKESIVSGHHSPSFSPNLLGLLADMGARPGDFPRIERLLDQMLSHQDAEGRFQSLGRMGKKTRAVWGSLFCDSHAILDVLVRFGRDRDPRTKRGLDRMAADITATAQGRGWLCRPDPSIGWRGPGRKDDLCPMVTLEALRCFARLPEKEQPAGTLDAARTCLRIWRERNTEKPYIFGHGRQFKTVKWPSFWYNAYAVLDTLSHYPALWNGRTARGEDRKSMAELAACLIAYNFNAEGRVIPRSCYQGFDGFTFGQKKNSSPTATALALVPLVRLSELIADIGAVDVLKLTSSKGGTGTPLPPPNLHYSRVEMAVDARRGG